MTFGNAIKVFRNGQRMTQSRVAQLAGISTSYLSLIERDKRDPNMSMVGKLSKAVGAPVIMIAFLMDSNRLSEINPALGQKTTDCVLGYLKAKTLQRQ